MQVTLSIIRYPKWSAAMSILAMAVFRPALWLSRKVTFFKLFGCSKYGGFEMSFDLFHWGMLSVSRDDDIFGVKSADTISNGPLLTRHYGRFINYWFKVFKCELWTILLEPAEGHGTWDGKKAFGEKTVKPVYSGPVAIITRATIRLNKIRAFWRETTPVSATVNGSKGLITAIGIGEIPWLKQATFSVWESLADMQSFAYEKNAHKTAMIKAKENRWFAEELFFRFKVLGTEGTINGINPLAGKL